MGLFSGISKGIFASQAFFITATLGDSASSLLLFPVLVLTRAFVHGETGSFPSGWTHAAPGGCFRRSECTLRGLTTKLESFCPHYTVNYTVSFVSERPREKVLPREQKEQGGDATHHNQLEKTPLKTFICFLF